MSTRKWDRTTRLITCLLAFTAAAVSLKAQADGCPTAPRNVQYSDSFYRAQAYYMQHDSSQNASLNAIVNGVPIGGSYAGKDYSTEQSSLTETQARQYIATELSNSRAQIAADCGATLCAVNATSTSTLGQVRAIDAIGQICAQALAPNAAAAPNNSSANNFVLRPAYAYSFFAKDQKTSNELWLSLENLTIGQLMLTIEQPAVPRGFKDPPVQYAGKSLTLTLKAKEVLRLPFKVVAPASADPTTHSEAVTIRANNDNSTFTTTEVVVVPYGDAMQGIPSMACGELQTNAYISCPSTDAGTFQANANQWFTLPLQKSGPDMNYRNQTACFAHTAAECGDAVASKQAFHTSLTISHELGGSCGPNGSNIGGEGAVTPNWKSKLVLPGVAVGQTWNLILKATTTVSQVHSLANPAQGPQACTLHVVGNNLVKDLSVPRPGSLDSTEIKGLSAGEYGLELRCPGIMEGCSGSPGGYVSNGTAEVHLDLDAVRVDQH